MFCKECKLEFYHRDDQAIKSLVQMGTFGHYPLFEADWIKEISLDKKNLTGNEKAKAKTLFKRLVVHRSLERKRTVIHSFDEIDRKLFVKAFMKMVENKILDLKPEIQ